MGLYNLKRLKIDCGKEEWMSEGDVPCIEEELK